LIGRHDGCSATHITSTIDPRDRPFILGTTGTDRVTLDEAFESAHPDLWSQFERESQNLTVSDAVDVARKLSPTFYWSCDKVRTPEGWYLYRGGSAATISRALVVARMVDVSWACMGHYDAQQAKEYAAAVQAAYPGKWMAYNFTGAFGASGECTVELADGRSH
jgi:isocitrate lyase